MAFTSKGEQYRAVSSEASLMSSRKASRSTKASRKGSSQRKKAVISSETTPSLARVVHGRAGTRRDAELAGRSSSTSSEFRTGLLGPAPLPTMGSGSGGLPRRRSPLRTKSRTWSASPEARRRLKISTASSSGRAWRKRSSSWRSSFSRSSSSLRRRIDTTRDVSGSVSHSHSRPWVAHRQHAGLVPEHYRFGDILSAFSVTLPWYNRVLASLEPSTRCSPKEMIKELGKIDEKGDRREAIVVYGYGNCCRPHLVKSSRSRSGGKMRSDQNMGTSGKGGLRAFGTERKTLANTPGLVICAESPEGRD